MKASPEVLEWLFESFCCGIGWQIADSDGLRVLRCADADAYEVRAITGETNEQKEYVVVRVPHETMLRGGVSSILRLFEEAKKAAGDAGRDAASQVEEVNKTRHYEVIGRLTTSTVYDGKKLPLMYRVQSVGDAVARTLGYLKPDPKLELEKKIGQIVGVAGAADVDPSLKLNVLTASRVDILSATPEKQEASAPDNH